MKIAFVTDSGTGKSVGELAQAEIYSVPLQAVSYTHLACAAFFVLFVLLFANRANIKKS